jgi:hypothetical protein
LELIPSISYYSADKIKDMYVTGDLFAWHLFKESKKLGEASDMLDQLVPAEYRRAAQHVAAFHKVLTGVHPSLKSSSKTSNYESGLLFVCARNMAMSASWYIPEGPFFDRASPFRLYARTGIRFPLTEEEHLGNMIARARGQRGEQQNVKPASEVMEMAERMIRWAREIQGFVDGQQGGIRAGSR